MLFYFRQGVSDPLASLSPAHVMFFSQGIGICLLFPSPGDPAPVRASAHLLFFPRGYLVAPLLVSLLFSFPRVSSLTPCSLLSPGVSSPFICLTPHCYFPQGNTRFVSHHMLLFSPGYPALPHALFFPWEYLAP